LAFSRKQPLQVKRVDINEFLRNVRRFLQRTLTENVELRINLGNEVPPVLVDPGQLENALLNLVINARDAMPAGGTLTIETIRERVALDEAAPVPELAPGDYVVIAVRDSGIGMSPEHMERAIEPFFTTKERGKGSGLGLSMVYGFAKQSGGDLLLRSTLGQGTTVSVLLPQAARTIEEDEAEPTPPNAPRGSEMVLLVEDEPRVRKLVKRSLLGLGYRVIEAENAAGAMKVLEDEVPVDLLFSDIVMPGNMNGPMLARWASHKFRGLKILLTTAFSEEVNRERTMGKEGFPLLNKPYSKEELASAVRAVLDAEASLRGPNQ
ncbi:MAG: ATP-binding protein, partial [Chromatiaceae bacterium]